MEQKKNQVKDIVKQDEDPHVYEGEIIHDDEEPAAIEKKIDQSPSKKFAYTLGKVLGGAITVLGLISEVGKRFKIDTKGPGEGNKRMGRRMRRFRRRR
ncbi:MAG: hypothetical protein JSV88_04625 [Candidatus Aminicenantes bacterium]|nr:MAG: hypothetical protein JSV88_04625 [Candidatus Aminicenantes bacterium]